MNKVRMLVVDDEPFIVEELAQLIQDRFADRVSLRYSDSAILAREMLQNEPCDILLTDVQMPGCNGFELARICQQCGENARIIFLSGYDQFAYAREAIRLDAYDYILKNEEDDRILGTIGRAIEDFLNERSSRQERLNHQDQIDKKNRQLRRYLLMDVLQGKHVRFAPWEYEQLKLHDPLWLLVASENHQHAQEVHPQKYEETVAQAAAFCAELSALCIWVEGIDLSIDFAFVAQVAEEQKEVFAAEVQRKLSQMDLWRYTRPQETKLNELYTQYRAESEKLYIMPDEEEEEKHSQSRRSLYSVIASERKSWSEVDVYRLRCLIEQCETGILTRMPSVARESADRLCDCLLGTCTANRSYAREICGRFATMLQHQLNINGFNLEHEKDVFSEIMTGLTEAKADARANIHAVIKQLLAAPVAGSNGSEQLVKQLKRLIKAYLSEDVTLTDLAALTNYSEGHLNRVFRKSEGVSVHAYINQKRLALAQKLLLTTDLRIGDVAALCGFDSASYFVRFFKKATHTTPQQYRVDQQKTAPSSE